MTGQTIGGKYQLIEMIREQMYYDAYAARLVNTETRNLVKLFKTNPADNSQPFEKLKANLAVVSSLRHPGIAYLRDFGQDENTVWLAEEYYEGAPLTQVLKSGASLNTLQALELGIKISEALAHAHGKGVVHGLLSPESIVVLGSLAVKISDFQALHSLAPAAGSTQGMPGRDPRYCAPEVLSGMQPKSQSDIFSFGVILYELLAGRRPFTSEQAMDIALDRNYHAPAAPAELNPHVPPLLNSVILKALKPRASSRYETASEMLSELLLCRSSIVRTMNREKFQAQSMSLKPTVPPAAQTPARDPGAPTPHASREPEPLGLDDLEKSLNLDDTMEKSHYRTKQILAVATVAIFIAVIAFIVGYGMKFFQSRDNLIGGEESQVVQVPNVVHLDETEAKFKLGHADLKTEIEKIFSADVPKGLVIRQDPPAGKKVKQGRTVKLIVSLGDKEIVVRDLRKLPLREAEQLATDMGFRVEVVREYSDEIAVDHIVDQLPKPGDASSAGNLLKLFVSKGPEPHEIAMPNLIGKNINDVYRILAEYDIPYGDIKSVPTNTFESGYVVSQSVLPGTNVDTKTMGEVMIYIAEPADAANSNPNSGGLFPEDDPFYENKKPAKQKAVTITVTQDASEVVVEVVDREGRTEAYRGKHNSGETVNLTVEGVGDVFVKVFINGHLEQQVRF
jgi:serine/threonine-protein kinase